MNFRALERRLTEDLPFILGGLYLVYLSFVASSVACI